MDGKFRKHEGHDKCVQIFVVKHVRKGPLERCGHSGEDNIKERVEIVVFLIGLSTSYPILTIM
jgi:hypothetical protein